jgi:hypothetical protein
VEGMITPFESLEVHRLLRVPVRLNRAIRKKASNRMMCNSAWPRAEKENGHVNSVPAHDPSAGIRPPTATPASSPDSSPR